MFHVDSEEYKNREILFNELENLYYKQRINTNSVYIISYMREKANSILTTQIADHFTKKDISTIGFINTPFVWEGQTKTENTTEGIIQLNKCCAFVNIFNSNILRHAYNRNFALKESFEKIDEIFLNMILKEMNEYP